MHINDEIDLFAERSPMDGPLEMISHMDCQKNCMTISSMASLAARPGYGLGYLYTYTYLYIYIEI